MNLSKILIVIVILAVAIVLVRVLLKPTGLKWEELPQVDCDEMMITAKVKGGAEPYTYSIDMGKTKKYSDDGDLSVAIKREGEYTFKVEDTEGNQLVEIINVPCKPKPVDVTDPCLDNKVNATARGYSESATDAADGKIKVRIKGGCPPYSIILDGKVKKKGIDGSSYVIKDLKPGGYKVRVESKEKDNSFDILNTIWVGKYKAPAPKISRGKLQKLFDNYISNEYDDNSYRKIEKWFSDENISVNSNMIGLSKDQSEKSIDEYLTRLMVKSETIGAVELVQITFDEKNEINTFTVNETPK